MDKLGPTGDFPQGKLNPHDEGGLTSAISTENGNVRIDFGKKIAWFAFPPEAAIAFACMIIHRAMEIERDEA